MANAKTCACCDHTSSTQQTLTEMDFERGIWSAAMNGELKRVSDLIFKGVDVNALDSSGYTALHYACRYGHVDIIKYLLERGACPNAQTRSGHVTPIQRAVYCGHVEAVHLLLERGARPELLDTDGRNALHKAAEKPRLELIELLLRTDSSLRNVGDVRDKCPVQYLPSDADPVLADLLQPD